MGEAKRRRAVLQGRHRAATAVLRLPNVTLIAIDTQYYELTRLAVQDSMRGVEFGAVLVFSDQNIAPDGATWVPCKNLNDATYYEPYSHVLWYDVPPLVKTSHFLVCQWDGWIINPQGWEPGWLNFDYIGSLQAWDGSILVGNGGFSLRSARLARYVADNQQSCPLMPHAVVDGKEVCHEDILLSKFWRRRLEAAGFRWADKGAALRFAFDRIINRSNQTTFGFHGYSNFPRVLAERRLNERIALINRQDVLADIRSTRNLVGLDGRGYGYMAH